MNELLRPADDALQHRYAGTLLSIDALEIGSPAPVPPPPEPEDRVMLGWKGDLSVPIVSVICITYQHAPFIRDALNGFLMQRTDFPFEIIVHDDASTDGTREIVQEYARNYPRMIRTILQDENIFSKGMNPMQFTFPMARGKYIALCEGDDYWLDSSKSQRQVALLEQEPSFVMCGHDAAIAENGRLVATYKLGANNKRDFSSKELQRGGWILTLSAMFRNKIQTVPEEFLKVRNGDFFLWRLLAEHGGAKYIDDIAPAIYRRHPGGIASSLTTNERMASAINTYFWMGQYYKRRGNRALADHYFNRAACSALVDASRIHAAGLFGVYLRTSKRRVAARYPSIYDVAKAIRQRVWKRRYG